ncbi:hypothetical protein H6P81_006278 [Aristolochia fimbriata]|uniref:Uncharacterized protein n=1 Tax=Aristolochia fimbriata TaxID=158543 RepID=A0AAV7EXU4_ARIFI|nr:hypothetical protein H6P81_006278 [Aristolochia fimbriata]
MLFWVGAFSTSPRRSTGGTLHGAQREALSTALNGRHSPRRSTGGGLILKKFYFFVAKWGLKHMQPGGVIINMTSVTAYKGSPSLLDYGSTKGAIVTFTRSLALQQVERGIRVNGVAPGPVWTPLIPASFSPEKTEKFGSEVPMKRVGQPNEIAPCYVFLASGDSTYFTRCSFWICRRDDREWGLFVLIIGENVYTKASVAMEIGQSGLEKPPSPWKSGSEKPPQASKLG